MDRVRKLKPTLRILASSTHVCVSTFFKPSGSRLLTQFASAGANVAD